MGVNSTIATMFNILVSHIIEHQLLPTYSYIGNKQRMHGQSEEYATLFFPLNRFFLLCPKLSGEMA